jgi:hypothetical protein
MKHNLTAIQNKEVVYSGADVSAYILAKAANLPVTDEFGNTLDNSYTQQTYSNSFIPFSNLGAISYSIHRDKMPVRKLGSSIAHSYTTGTRTIAGSIVVINFDRAAFFELLSDRASNTSDSIYGFSLGSEQYSNMENKTSDQLPPFDLLLIFSEELKGSTFPNKGKSTEAFARAPGSRLMIKSIRLTDEGMVTGTDEAYLESTFQYVAEDIEYLKPIKDEPALTPPIEDISIPVGPAVPYKRPAEVQTTGEEETLNEVKEIQENKGSDLYVSNSNLTTSSFSKRDIFGNLSTISNLYTPHSVFLLHDGTQTSLDINIASPTPFNSVQDVVVTKADAPSGTLFTQPSAGTLNITDPNETDPSKIVKDSIDTIATKTDEASLLDLNILKNIMVSSQIASLNTKLSGWSPSQSTLSISSVASGHANTTERNATDFSTNSIYENIKLDSSDLYYYIESVDPATQSVNLGLTLSNLDTSGRRITGVINYNPLEHPSNYLMLPSAVYAVTGNPSSSDITISQGQRYFPFLIPTEYIVPDTEYTLTQDSGNLWNTIGFTPLNIPWRKETEIKTIKVTVPAKVKEISKSVVHDIYSDTLKFNSFKTAHDLWESSTPESSYWDTMNKMIAVKLPDPVISDAYLTPHSLTMADIPNSTTPSMASDDPDAANISVDLASLDYTNPEYDTINIEGYMNSISMKKSINKNMPAIDWSDSPHAVSIEISNKDISISGTAQLKGFVDWWQVAFPNSTPAKITANLDNNDLVDISASFTNYIDINGTAVLAQKTLNLPGFVYDFTYQKELGGTGVTSSNTFNLNNITTDLLNFPLDQTSDRILDVFLLPKLEFDNKENHPGDWYELSSANNPGLYYPDAHAGDRYVYKLDSTIHYSVVDQGTSGNSQWNLVLNNDVLTGALLENPKIVQIETGKNKNLSIPIDLDIPSSLIFEALDGIYIGNTNVIKYSSLVDSFLATPPEQKLKSRNSVNVANNIVTEKASDSEDWSYSAQQKNTVFGDDTTFTIIASALSGFHVNRVNFTTGADITSSINIPDVADALQDKIEVTVIRADSQEIARTIERSTTSSNNVYTYNDSTKTLTINKVALYPPMVNGTSPDNSPLQINVDAQVNVEIEKVDPNDIDGYNTLSIPGSLFDLTLNVNGDPICNIIGNNLYTAEFIPRNYAPSDLAFLPPVLDPEGWSITDLPPQNVIGNGDGTYSPIIFQPTSTGSHKLHFSSFATEDTQPIKEVKAKTMILGTETDLIIPHSSVTSPGWTFANNELSVPFESIFPIDPVEVAVNTNFPDKLHNFISIDGVIPTNYFETITKIEFTDLNSGSTLVLDQSDGSLDAANISLNTTFPYSESTYSSPEWFLDNSGYGYKHYTGGDKFIISKGPTLLTGAPAFPHYDDGEVSVESPVIDSLTVATILATDLSYKATYPNQAFRRLRSKLNFHNDYVSSLYTGALTVDTDAGGSFTGSWSGEDFALQASTLVSMSYPSMSLDGYVLFSNNGFLSKTIPWFKYLKDISINGTSLTHVDDSSFSSANVIGNTIRSTYQESQEIQYNFVGLDPAVEIITSRTSPVVLNISEQWRTDHPKPVDTIFLELYGNASKIELDASDWSIDVSGNIRTLTITAADKFQYPVHVETLSGGSSDNYTKNINGLPGIHATSVDEHIQTIKVNNINILTDNAWTEIDAIENSSAGLTSAGLSCYSYYGFYAYDSNNGYSVATSNLEGFYNVYAIYMNGIKLSSTDYSINSGFIGAFPPGSYTEGEVLTVEIQYSAEKHYTLLEGELIIYSIGNPISQDLPASFNIEIDYLTTGIITYEWSAAGQYKYNTATSKVEMLTDGDPNFPTIGTLSNWNDSQAIDIEYGHSEISMDLEVWYLATGFWYRDEDSPDKRMWIFNAPGDGYDIIEITGVPAGDLVQFDIKYSSRGYFTENDEGTKLLVYHPEGVQESWSTVGSGHAIEVPFEYGDREVTLGLFYSSAGFYSVPTYNIVPSADQYYDLIAYRPSDLTSENSPLYFDYKIHMRDQSIVINYSGKGYYSIELNDLLTVYNPGASNSYMLSGVTIPETPLELNAHFLLDDELFYQAAQLTENSILKPFEEVPGTFIKYTPSTMTLKNSDGNDIAPGLYNLFFLNIDGEWEDGDRVTSVAGTDPAEIDPVAGTTGNLQPGIGLAIIDWTNNEFQYNPTTGDINNAWQISDIAKNNNRLSGYIRELTPLNLNLEYITLADGLSKEILQQAALQESNPIAPVDGIPSPLTTFSITSTTNTDILTNGLPWDTALFSTLIESTLPHLFQAPNYIDESGTALTFPPITERRDFATDSEMETGYQEGASYDSYTTFSGLPAATGIDAQLIRVGQGHSSNGITQKLNGVDWLNNSQDAIIRFSNFPISTEDVEVTVNQEVWKPVPLNYDYYIFEPILYKIDYTLENKWSEYRFNITSPNVSFKINSIFVFTTSDFGGTGRNPEDETTRNSNMLELDPTSYAKGTDIKGSTDGFVKIKATGLTGKLLGSSITDQSYSLSPGEPIWVDYSISHEKSDYTRAGYVVWESDNNAQRWSVVTNNYDSDGFRNLLTSDSGVEAIDITSAVSSAKRIIIQNNA